MRIKMLTFLYLIFVEMLIVNNVNSYDFYLVKSIKESLVYDEFSGFS